MRRRFLTYMIPARCFVKYIGVANEKNCYADIANRSGAPEGVFHLRSRISMLQRMALSKDDVRHVAKLARLELTDAEISQFTKDLSGIFELIEKLQEVNTADVEPTAQVTGLTTVVREDTVRAPLATPDALLATSPLPIREHQIETPSAHGN